ncbi:hypothetical protein [Legionella taurinensis]|uniref:Uncharacterized protein n=1 Tax=Legionella taurinensis TaxID=70611 RepID=A0A3A5L6N5_9GAMM|nr:hypothetical protein [Legionella taurinensis]RJT48687.1 hypothetical protein D6J04_02825 [Legionella taurinensis]RJT69675.1 hypothetical protein D6J03_00630 [Legionella taurinensis]STY24967.1 Rho GTPase (Miro-like) [Legionella taurinensis]
MGASSILIYGKTTKAKTQFIERLAQINLKNMDIRPVCVTCREEGSANEYLFWILDTSYEPYLALYCRDMPVVLYFIEHWDETQITSDIDALKKINSSLPILIVDAIENQDEIAVASFADCPVLRVANREDMNRDGLFQTLNQMIKAKKRSEQEPYFLFKNQLTAMARAKGCALQGSVLYHALENLEHELKSVPPETRDAIAQSAEKLMLAWQRLENMENKDAITSTFLHECQAHVYGKHYMLAQAIVTVAIIATLTLAAAIIGFGVGFGLGLWSGPGAFFSGIVAGAAAANAVLGLSAIGGVAGGIVSYGLFKSNPVMKAANGVTQAMKLAPVYMDTDL